MKNNKIFSQNNAIQQGNNAVLVAKGPPKNTQCAPTMMKKWFKKIVLIIKK